MKSFRLLLPALLVSAFFSVSSLEADDHAVDLMLQTRRMQSWLGAGERAEGWRRYLAVHRLESEAVKGWHADPSALAKILQRFDSKARGLDHPIFAAVRDSLRRHLDQLSRFQPMDIGSAVDDAVNQYRPLTNAEVKTQQERLLGELYLLQSFYRRTLSADEFDAINKKLELSALIDVVKSMDVSAMPAEGDDGSADRRKELTENRATTRKELQAAIRRFASDASLRKDTYFPIVNRQLNKLFIMVSIYDNDRGETSFQQFATRLKTQLASVSDPTQRAEHGALGQTLGWLECAGQVPMLIGAIRQQYSRPNFEFSVNESFVRAIATRPVNSTEPVNEVILGRQIYGTGTTVGQVKVDFVEDPGQAHISLQMLGTNFANSYTQQGRITAYSTSQTELEARRSLLVNMGGIHEYRPYVAANLNSQFDGVNSIRLIERIARRKYQKDKYASEAIGARRAEQKLYRQFDEQTSEVIRNGKLEFQKLVDRSSPNSGLIPSSFLKTSDNQLWITSYKAGTFQLGANLPPPEYDIACDVKVRIHESMLANYLETIFSRQRYSNKDFAERAEEIFGTTPEDYDPKAPEEWSITFRASRPIEVILDNNRIGISAMGRRFTRGKQPIREPMSINAQFRVESHGDKLRLVPDKEISVDFTRGGVKSVQMNAFRSFLQDLLNKKYRGRRESG